MFTNDNAIYLANTFQPILLFDPTERFFPVAPEEWLTHRSKEPWPGPETHERGTAVLKADRTDFSFTDANVVAGSHFPAGDHIGLTNTAPNGIGQNFGVDVDFSAQDLFLTVGGWDNLLKQNKVTSGFVEGSIEYLDLLFRKMANALNPAIEIDSPSPAPDFTVPRINAPTVIAEVEWAGMYPRMDQARVLQNGDMPDFPPGTLNGERNDEILRDLDSYIAITYYMLYPVLDTAPEVKNDGVFLREGQWEAITIYLKGQPADQNKDQNGRPDFMVGDEGPATSDALPLSFLQARFLSYSRGYDLGSDNNSPLNAEVRPIGNYPFTISIFNGHPLAYVSAGTHKNFYEIGAFTNTGSPSQSDAGKALNGVGTGLMGAAGIVAGICAIGIATIVAALACFIVAFVIFLIGLILFLISFFLNNDPPVTESPDPDSTDLARDGGPGALPANQSAPTVAGLQTTGNTLQANLRVINRFGFDPAAPVTTYPQQGPAQVEMPTWWNFPGRWGVRILNNATNTWDSGTRRVDNYGRSRAYWNTYQLVAFLNDPQRSVDGITA